MVLITEFFSVRLEPRRSVDDEDWVRVHVTLSATPFSGDFEAWLQLGDLTRFKMELEDMYAKVGAPCSAELSSAEPDIRLRLQSEILGGISGDYRFQDEPFNRMPAVVSGVFRMDQSFIPELAASTGLLIQDLGGGNGA